MREPAAFAAEAGAPARELLQYITLQASNYKGLQATQTSSWHAGWSELLRSCCPAGASTTHHERWRRFGCQATQLETR